MKDSEFMKKCLALAEKGRMLASPNPLVGAVVVKNNKVIATGFHKVFGKAHAETIALKKAGKKAKGATLYVNLEPCCHFGKQPPCTQAIINAKVKEVVIGVKDPNPLVDRKGIAELKKNKVKIRAGVLKKQAIELNEKFFKFKKTKTPFVLIKNAVSANGKISFARSRRKKISSKESIKKVHELRSEFDAVLVGINTVIKDNPRLTARIKKAKNPLRIIVDSVARIPLNSRVLNDGRATIVVCTKRAKKAKLQKITDRTAGIVIAKEKKGLVDLADLLKQLGKMGISSVMVEGGAKVTSSILRENLFDKMILIISPKIVGRGKSFLTEEGLLKKLEIKKIGFVGEDAWVTFYPEKGISK